jgi:hypothetical protein
MSIDYEQDDHVATTIGPAFESAEIRRSRTPLRRHGFRSRGSCPSMALLPAQ